VEWKPFPPASAGKRSLSLTPPLLIPSHLTTGDNNIDIGNRGVADEANTIRIGTGGTHMTTFIAGISGKTAAGGIPGHKNIIDSFQKLIVSPKRFIRAHGEQLSQTKAARSI
jgi:hypothetical protein